MTQFVIAYRRSIGEIVERRDFPVEQRDAAWSLRLALIRKYLADPDVEVVLLGSDSEDTLRRTHHRYFQPSRAA